MKKTLVENLFDLMEEELFGDNFGLSREREWTYYFGGVPILDMEQKTGGVPRWLANFYHGGRPDPDDGGPWENNVAWESVVGPAALAILLEPGQTRFLLAYVVKGTEDTYLPTEEVEVPREFSEAFMPQFYEASLSLLDAIASAEKNAGKNKKTLAPGDYVFYLASDGRVLVGTILDNQEDQFVVDPFRMFKDYDVFMENYEAEYVDNLPGPERVSLDQLYPLPVSGFGIE